jgi:hypothetical protein
MLPNVVQPQIHGSKALSWCLLLLCSFAQFNGNWNDTFAKNKKKKITELDFIIIF